MSIFVRGGDGSLRPLCDRLYTFGNCYRPFRCNYPPPSIYWPARVYGAVLDVLQVQELVS